MLASAFDDGLDLVSVHRKLIDEFMEPLEGSKSRLPVKDRVEEVVKVFTPSIYNYEGFYSVSVVLFRW